MKMFRVLIAEDEYWMRERLASLIDWPALGFELVSSVENGQQALDILQQTQIDILLTDIRMPVMDGLCLLDTVVSMNKHVQTVVISGFDEFEYVRGAMRCGALDYLMKPVREMDLLKVLTTAVENIEKQQHAIRTQIQTKQLIQEATTLMIDEAMSAWLDHGEGFDREMQMKLRGMGVPHHFLNFYLYLVRVVDWRHVLSIFDQDNFLAVFAMKNVLQELFGAGEPLVFHHISSPGEFGLVIESTSGLIQRYEASQKDSMLERLQDFLPSKLLIAESRMISDSTGFKKAWWRLSSHVDHHSINPEKSNWFDGTTVTSTWNDANVNPPDGSVRAIARQAAAYIESHLREELTLSSLAEMYNVKPGYLSTIFREEMGKPMMLWISQVRVRKAMQLLDAQGGKWGDIALQVGYEDYVYFSKVFKKMTGMSPSEYALKRKKG